MMRRRKLRDIQKKQPFNNAVNNGGLPYGHDGHIVPEELHYSFVLTTYNDWLWLKLETM